MVGNDEEIYARAKLIDGCSIISGIIFKAGASQFILARSKFEDDHVTIWVCILGLDAINILSMDNCICNRRGIIDSIFQISRESIQYRVAGQTSNC